MHVHRGTRLSSMTAAWLLPIVSTIVAAATGGIVAEIVDNLQHALWMWVPTSKHSTEPFSCLWWPFHSMIISYILWGMGVPLTMSVLVVYFQRLTVYSLPPREVIVSVFLPLGALGQGGFGIMQLGNVARKVMPKTGTLSKGPGPDSIAGEMLYNVGWVVALIM